MTEGLTYTFREITKLDELISIFRLRYKLYYQSSNRVFLSENPYLIDVKIFDTHCRHFGIYQDDKIVTYLRGVMPPEQNFNPEVYEFGRNLSLICETADY